MTRLETIIESIGHPLMPKCPHITAGLMVANELPASEERDAVIAEIEALAESCRKACRHYNNLRSLVGTLERSQGNPAPQFYEGELRSGGLPIDGCNCCTLKKACPARPRSIR